MSYGNIWMFVLIHPPGMARSSRIITLNLGSQTISLAEFRRQAQAGLILQNYRFRETLIDPADERIDQGESTALRELLDELQVKGFDTNWAISGQSVFTRFVKLPAIEEEKIGRII